MHTQTDVDKSGKSYMGETGLYYMLLEGKGKAQNVQLRKRKPRGTSLGDSWIDNVSKLAGLDVHAISKMVLDRTRAMRFV